MTNPTPPLAPEKVAAAALAAQSQLDEIFAAWVPGTPAPAELIIGCAITAYNYVDGGDPVGVIRRDPSTGSIAVRVLVGGVPTWSVTDGTNGSQYYDQHNLDWPTV